MAQAPLDMDRLSQLPIVWHSTTPRRFVCQAGCLCCCVNTLFFPSEAEALPPEVQDLLVVRNGLIHPQQRSPGICAFFDERLPWHCRIPEQRPLRCRLYPYLPLVTTEAIVIVADPLCTVSWPEAGHPAWYRCYGLGRGPEVTEQVEAMSREFLGKVVREYPGLAPVHLRVENVDDLISWREVEKQQHPRYAKWDTEMIRRVSAEEAS